VNNTRRAAVTEVCESHFKTDQAREVARAGASGTRDRVPHRVHLQAVERKGRSRQRPTRTRSRAV